MNFEHFQTCFPFEFHVQGNGRIFPNYIVQSRVPVERMNFAKPTRIKCDATTYVSVICYIPRHVNSLHAQILSRKILIFIYRVFNELDIAVGDDFLGLCTEECFYQHGSCSEWLWCCGGVLFFIYFLLL